MTPLCKIDVTLAGVREASGVHDAGGVDEQEGIRPARGLAGRSDLAVCVSRMPALLSLKRRQVFRLLAGLKHGGAASLVSKRRGRPSNNRLPEAYRDLALSLVRERYADFGPTLAAEKLAEVHGLQISRETLRGWMIAAGLWIDRRHRLPSPHQPRRRRDCLGELVQIDGSEHAWFEDRGRSARCWRLLTMRQAD